MKNYTNKVKAVKPKSITSLIAIALFISACASAETPSPTATEKPIETEAAVEVLPEADECLMCHTDKQRLIDTASQVVDTESESTGVG